MINHRHPQYATLNQTQIQAINLLHVAREAMLTAANNDVESAKAIYPSWMALEAVLQRLWGFPEDVNWVKFWYYPYCTCPTIDNNDAYPHGYYSYSGSCPIHGHKLAESSDSKELKDVLEKTLGINKGKKK